MTFAAVEAASYMRASRTKGPPLGEGGCNLTCNERDPVS